MRNICVFSLATPTSESPLRVVDSNGVTLTTLTDEPAIVVLFGRGLDQWLVHPEDRKKFRAAPHFVPALKSGKKRVIFARMYVAPKEAIPTHGDRSLLKLLQLIFKQPYVMVFLAQQDLANR